MSDSYAGSVAAYQPASFVADTPITSRGGAPKITLLPETAEGQETSALGDSAFTGTLNKYMQELSGVDPTGGEKADETSKAPSIGEGVKSYFKDVNDQLVSSDQKTRDLLSGKTHDTGAVAAAVEEADLSLDMMLAITKRVTSAYQTIQNITF
jgi:flagellar hook-basal body complex protein FliE